MPNDLDSSALINRGVEVTLINQSASGQTYFERDKTNALVVTDLRVQFEIKKSISKDPNSCKITITNLADNSRSRFDRRPNYVLLRAGHNGVLRPLFEGNTLFSRSDLKSPDWETKLQIHDGGRAFSNAFMRRSYTPPVNVRQVLTDAAASLNLSLPPDVTEADELRAALAGGFAHHGPTRDALTKVLTPLGYGWSIQNGRLQILKAGLPNANTAWVIEPSSGMIASPEGNLPSKPGGVSELTVKVLLFPEIVPGDTIRLNSKAYAGGLWRVNDVEHKGDTHGADWITTLKVSPLGSPAKSGRGRKK